MRAAILVVLVGCVETEASLPAQTAHDMFVNAAWPALGGCVGCHGAQPTIDFLAPGTADGAYNSLIAFQPAIVDLASPSASLLVTMGKHTGPALDPTAAEQLLGWLAQEQKERAAPPAMSVEVGPVTVALGSRTALDLPAGGKLVFVGAQLAGGLDLSQLAITAGSRGLHVVHPLFVSHPDKLPAVIDANDRFADVDVHLGAGEQLALGGGETTLVDFDPATPISINFLTLEAP